MKTPRHNAVVSESASRVTVLINGSACVINGPFHFDEEQKPHFTWGPQSVNLNFMVSTGKENFLVHPDDIDALIATIDTLRTGKSADYHVRVIASSGKVRWLHGFGRISGEVQSASPVEDIRPRIAELERQLRQNKLEKELLQKCLDAIPQMVWVSDAKGNFLMFNDRWISYTGLTPERISGYQYIKSGLIHPSQLKEVTVKWHQSLKYGLPFHNETLIRNAAGDYRWHLDSIAPWKDDSEKVIYWIGTLTDVHEEFTTEKNIQENNDLLEAIFNCSPNGIQVLEGVRDDDSNKIVDFEWKYCNVIAEQIFDQSPLTGKLFSAVYPDGVDTKLMETFKEVTLKGDPLQIEYPLHINNAVRWYEVSCVKLEDGVVATFHDITLRKEAEAEAGEGRHFIQQIANSTPDIIYVIDLYQQKIVYANGRVKEFLGIDAEELYRLGPSVMDKLMHPDDCDRRMVHIRGLVTLADSETREIEVRLRSGDGQWRWFRIRDTLFKREADGRVRFTIGLVQDVNDLKTAEHNILLQHQMDRLAEKIAQVGNWLWNLTTGELTCGENLYYLLGHTPGEVQPSLRTFIESIHPDDREFFIAESQKLKNMDNGPLPLFYVRVQRKDGTIRYLRAASELITAHGEKKLIGTVRDVTQDILNEKEIRERITFIETLLESSINRIAVVDKNMRYLIWNRKCEEVYGLKKESVLGKTVQEVFPQINEKPVMLERIESALNGTLGHFPTEKSAKSDHYHEDFYVPLKNDQQVVYAVLITMYDITDKIVAQRELQIVNESLRRKNEKLSDMNEQLSTFAFVASHDLREPLRKIEVFTTSILENEDELTVRGRAYFEKIRSSVDRMNRMINDILDFSGIHASEVGSEKVNVNEVVSTICSDLRDTIEQKQATIQCSELPSLHGKRSQLMQLFQNLIVNAIKFQPADNKPFITIAARKIHGREIHNAAARREAQYLCISVSDNGIGFEEEYQSRIFQMFQRLHGVTQYNGTGMGLAICKKVMENHHGFIEAKSTPGAGAVFNCYFPL
jgi:PAS domain S-box-containing protein